MSAHCKEGLSHKQLSSKGKISHEVMKMGDHLLGTEERIPAPGKMLVWGSGSPGVVPRPATSVSPGACWKCKLSGPSPDLTHSGVGFSSLL